ncbi:MAG: ribosome recycling factor [Clostridia bacterium]|nr:ribosome recycling factor [Clostridia bacterium]MBQ6059078.1 ribosome recycling factor [Clostridia bacterium]
MKEMYRDYEDRMSKAISVLETEYKSLRAGRANPAVLDRLSVDYYGVATPINQLASLSVTEARTLTISPYDASTLKSIEKAILTSDIGINPQNDGRAIRLVFPPLTEERRKELAKQVKKLAEDSKVAIRNIRRDAIDTFKKRQKKSEITEDDLKDAEKELQELTDKMVKKIDEVSAAKEKEILEV